MQNKLNDLYSYKNMAIHDQAVRLVAVVVAVVKSKAPYYPAYGTLSAN